MTPPPEESTLTEKLEKAMPHMYGDCEDCHKDIKTLIQLIHERERLAREDELKNLPVGLFDSTPYRDERLSDLSKQAVKVKGKI